MFKKISIYIFYFEQIKIHWGEILRDLRVKTARGYSSVAQHLPSKYKVMSLISGTKKQTEKGKNNICLKCITKNLKKYFHLFEIS